ncbi:MAG: C45 family peptidase, partial [Pseudomonadota bacterium]
MKKLFKFLFISLILLTLILSTLVYIGNVPLPQVSETPLTEKEIKKSSQFFPKEKWGIHHVFLEGTDFERGQQYGYWTKDFLFKQESALLKKINQVIPYSALRYGLFFFSMGWFYGLDQYYEKNWQEEMYGVSLYGSKVNLYFATPYTRQLAYHGIHDMGQMMIDHGLVLGACTQIAMPVDDGWLIGRNFDFEAGPVFDLDKVLKWVFPEKGQAFVSIIFSGMVGVISGINESGVYIAMNAAGSDDFARLGTPATLVLLKALQNASSAKTAVEILQETQSLITDIFVVVDGGPEVYVVEKTPERSEVLSYKKATVITNHLQHPNWSEDKTNQNRKANNTTLARQKRGESLLGQLQENPTPQEMVDLLRDKVIVEGRPVFSHRSSIDAMIASHSLVYDSAKSQLYVSQGPSLSQPYFGYDLKESFEQKRPVPIGEIPADPDTLGINFYKLKDHLNQIEKSRKLAQAKDCDKADSILKSIDHEPFNNHYQLSWARAEISLCRGQTPKAHE